MLSLEAHLGVTASPQAPFPTDFVTLPVSASHRRFGSLPLAAEKGHAPVPQHQLHRVLHSKHAQATSPPCWRATLAGRTIGFIHAPALAHRAFVLAKRFFEQRYQFDHPPMHCRMIDADGALSHHRLEIPKTERIGHIPSHAQQHHIQRIMKSLQNLGNACSKGRSWSRDLLHRVPKQS